MISSLPHITLLSQTFTILDFRGRKPPLVLVVFVFKIKTHIQIYKHTVKKPAEVLDEYPDPSGN